MVRGLKLLLCSFLFFSTTPPRARPDLRPAAERWREALADALAVVASELTLGATAVGCQYAIAARRRDA